MKLASLNAFVAAVKTGSLRGAARQLGVSQPGLTKLIRELEVELAAPLLLRTSKGVMLTTQGEVLFEHAQKVSQELTAATDKIHQLSGDMRGALNIAAVPVAVMLLIPEALRTFGREFPDIRLRVREELFLDQLQLLRTGNVDIAVGGIPEGLSSGEFIVEPLMETTMVVVVRRGSPYEEVRSLAQLAQAKWVYTSTTADTGYARRLFDMHGLPPPVINTVVNSTLTLLALISGSDHVGLMPEQIARHPLAGPHMSILPLAEAGLPLTVGAIIRSDSVVSPALRQFIRHLHRAAHRLQEPVSARQATRS